MIKSRPFMADQKFGNLWERQKFLLENTRSGVPLILAINADISYVNMYLSKIKFLHDINFKTFHYFSYSLHLFRNIIICFCRQCDLNGIFIKCFCSWNYEAFMRKKNCYIKIHIDKSSFRFLLHINVFLKYSGVMQFILRS